MQEETNKDPEKHEEYLRKHIDNLESNKSVDKNTPINSNVGSFDSAYFNFPVEQYPCGIFYEPGTMIQIRPAMTKEIQAYSMVDDSNYADIFDKMNDMISSCLRIKKPNGQFASYLELKDPDRFCSIFHIRDITFQSGPVLTVPVTCTCGITTQVKIIKNNFSFYGIDSMIASDFNRAKRTFIFELVNNSIFELAPPTIGLSKCFSEYILRENAEKRKQNLAFLKIIPFTMPGVYEITMDGIKEKLKEFESMDDISFQFLNSAVSKMTFGIEKIKGVCQCGLQVTSDMLFPDGASGIFIIPDAFERYRKK
jgi:hypothetical protein